MDSDAINALFLKFDESQRSMLQQMHDKIDKNHKDVVRKINSKFNALVARQWRSDEMNRKTVNSINVVLRIVAGIMKLSGEQLTQNLKESDGHLNNLKRSKNADEHDQIPPMPSFVNQVKSLLAELNGAVDSWENNNFRNMSSENTISPIDSPQQIKTDSSQQTKIDDPQQVLIKCEPGTSTACRANNFNEVICLSDTESDTSHSGNDCNGLKNCSDRASNDSNVSSIKDPNHSVLNYSNTSVTLDGHCSAIKQFNSNTSMLNRNLEEIEKKRRFYKNKYNYKSTTYVSGHPDPRTVLSIPNSGTLKRPRSIEPEMVPIEIDANDPIKRKKSLRNVTPNQTKKNGCHMCPDC